MFVAVRPNSLALGSQSGSAATASPMRESEASLRPILTFAGTHKGSRSGNAAVIAGGIMIFAVAVFRDIMEDRADEREKAALRAELHTIQQEQVRQGWELLPLADRLPEYSGN